LPAKRWGHRFLAPVLLAACLSAGVALRGDGTYSPRAQRIGSQLLCTCGCMEGALTCTTLNCSVKLTMQSEIRQRTAATNVSDQQVLQSFVQEYGTQVLANTDAAVQSGVISQRFGRLSWIFPWLMVGLGLALVVIVVKRWRHEAAPVMAGNAAAGAELDPKLRAEIAAELGDLDEELKR
jgi:cytochrome c-type biogenesis protein CcmH/NrfF